ncbi:MAG: hypothetical protein JWQ40_2695 [Segetibacter sp.]|nr:hypothetical protein [Segetibacter sp.]
MKNKLLTAFLLIAFSQTNAQYYYSDIVGTKQTNQLYKLLLGFQYKRISATSYEGNEPSKDFVLEQNITNDGKQVITRSATIGSRESFFISNYQNNRISKTVDSGNNAINTVLYEYDKTGKVVSINSTSKDFDGTFTNTEQHIWMYNDKGLPEKMLKIKNQTDTTSVAFIYDEEDNVAEERWSRNKRRTETYYYYYNPKKQLTDIVRYNRKAKTMLPDYMFEYDNRGHITQMTQTQNGTANYLTWKYVYNENGMKEKEYVFNKQKELLGRIEYKYQ